MKTKLKLLLLTVLCCCFNLSAQEEFSSNFQTVCVNQEVSFIADNHLTLPSTAYSWSVTPTSGWIYSSGSSTSAYPKIRFSSKGNYTISLTVSGKTVKKCEYIHVVNNNQIQTIRNESKWNSGSTLQTIGTHPCPNYPIGIVRNMLRADFLGCDLLKEEVNDQIFGDGAPSTISNIDGGLLFYSGMNQKAFFYCGGNPWIHSNFGHLFNRHNKIMSGSATMDLSFIGRRTVLSLPMPGTCNSKYFVFHLTFPVTAPWTAIPVHHANYSIVDMDGDNGLGSVTSKNIVFDNVTSLCIAAVPKANNSDYWIIIHDYGLNQFRVYELTSSGFNTTPVQTINIGTVILPYSAQPVVYQGEFKVSPDRKKLALNSWYMNGSGNFQSFIDIFDFNDATGNITNAQTTTPFTPTFSSTLNSIEFSPSSQYLFVDESAFSNFYVIDLNSGTIPYVPATVTVPTPNSGYGGPMQITSDGTIWSMLGYLNNISTISNLNAGTGMTINSSGISKAPTNTDYIPFNNGVFARDFLYQEYILSVGKADRLKYICPGGSVGFSVSPTISLTGTQWYSLKDGAIGGATGNSISGINVSGIYYFEGTDVNGKTYTAHFFAKDYSCYDFGLKDEYLVCPGASAAMTVKYDCDVQTVKWYNKTTSTLITQGPPSTHATQSFAKGEYYLEILTVSGCTLRFDFKVTEEPLPALNTSYTATCGNSVTMDPGNFKTYTWYVQYPGGTKTVIPGATSRTLKVWKTGTYWVKVKTHILECVIEISTTVTIDNCCPVQSSTTNAYQSSYNFYDNANTSQAYDGRPVALFKGTNNHSYVLKQFTNLSSNDFGITELDHEGNMVDVRMYTSTDGFLATDMIESITPNGKIVIGHKNNKLYIMEINPDGTVSTNRRIVTLPNSTGSTLEATSIVRSYYNNGASWGYGILVNLRASNNFNRVYLVGCLSNINFFWVNEVQYIQNSTSEFHAHKLMAYTDNGETSNFIVMARVSVGTLNKGVIVDTKLNFGGAPGGTPVRRVTNNIYFSGAVIPYVGYVFAGSTNPVSFNTTANAAFLRTDFSLGLVAEKTFKSYRMEALNVVPSPSTGNPVFLLMSMDLVGSTNPYFYHLLELDQNLAVISGRNIRTLDKYQNLNNDHDPYISCKTMLTETDEGGYTVLGQEEGSNDFYITKTGSNLLVNCSSNFEPKMDDDVDGFVQNSYVNLVSSSTSALTLTEQGRNMSRTCCNERTGTPTPFKCNFYIAAQNISYTTGTSDLYSGNVITFEALGNFDPSEVDHYEWDFGDGTIITSTTNPVTHIFNTPVDQSYTVNLTIHYKNGCVKNYYNVTTIYICVDPVTTKYCHRIIYECELMYDPEGVLPDCEDCYPTGPTNHPVEMTPLIMLTDANGKITYRREIINRDKCTKCVFTFEFADKACDFNQSYMFLPMGNGHIQVMNTSTPGFGVYACGTPQWTVKNKTTGVYFPMVYLGETIIIDGELGQTYEICLTVTYCYMCNGVEQTCSRTICFDVIATMAPEYKDNGGIPETSDASKARSLSTKEVLTNKADISIRPNPSSDKFTVFNPSGIQNYDQVTIYNANGQVILSRENISADFEYNLGDYANGIYFIRISAGNETRTLKLILQ
jgi:hypothetical protein